MSRLGRSLLALSAFFALAIVLAACGDGVPGNSVVRVDDTLIKKTTFDHWLRVAAIASQGPQAAGNPKIPDAPGFTACIADKKKAAPKPPAGQPKPTDAQFKAQCKQEYEGLRDQVLQFLISAEWIQGEAADQGVEVTDAEVQKRFKETKQQSFPKEKDFQKFLEDSGMNLQDILFRVRLDALSNKLREKITKGKDKVSDAQIKAYYDKNKQRFAQPERRDLRIVLTKTKAKAEEARRALDSGESFAKVAKRLSIDQASKDQGGRLLGVSKGQQEKALDDAVFAAKKGELAGPVKTQFGWYVFEVEKVTPATQQTLAQTRETIKQLLASQNQQKALDDFVKKFRSKWKDRTNCRKGFITQDCKNAPEPKRQSTVPPGAVPQPQQGAPQGAPPQGAPPAPPQP